MSDFFLSDKQFIQNYLRENDIFLKKKYGQNFVVDPDLLDWLLTTASLKHGDLVVEIGAGAGSLTEQLLASGAQVIAVEIDKRLVNLLKTHFAHSPAFELVEGDFLRVDVFEKVRQLIAAHGKPVKVVANVPYYITSPILTKILESGLPVSDIVITIQQEVAHRLVADIGTKEYSAITLFMQYYGETDLIATFPPTSFFPSPRVWSSIVHFYRYEKRPFSIDYPLFLHHCVKLCFTERRKMIKNSISHVIKSWQVTPDAHWIETMLEESGIDPHLRPEQVSIEQFIQIGNRLWTIYPDEMKHKWLS